MRDFVRVFLRGLPILLALIVGIGGFLLLSIHYPAVMLSVMAVAVFVTASACLGIVRE